MRPLRQLSVGPPSNCDEAGGDEMLERRKWRAKHRECAAGLAVLGAGLGRALLRGPASVRARRRQAPPLAGKGERAAGQRRAPVPEQPSSARFKIVKYVVSAFFYAEPPGTKIGHACWVLPPKDICASSLRWQLAQSMNNYKRTLRLDSAHRSRWIFFADFGKTIYFG